MRTLLNYISDGLDETKKNPESQLFDQNNEEISEEQSSDLIEDWSNNFDDFKVEKDDQEIIDKIDTIKQDLNDKLYGEGLTEKEGQFLTAIKLFETGTYNPDKVTKGALCHDKNNDDLGFVLPSEHKENVNFYSIKSYPYISKSITPIEYIKPIDRDINKISKTKPKNFSHIVLSAGGDNPDPKAILAGTKDFLELNFKSKGYDYAYALHTNTDNPHVHVVLNNHSKQHDYKFIPNKYDLQELRMDYARHLNGYGVNRTAVLKFDKKNALDNIIKEVKQNESHNLNFYNHKLNDKKDENFDLLKFKKKSLYALDKMSRKLEYYNEPKLAKKVKEQKNAFIKAEKEHIPKIIENTLKIIKTDDKKWQEHCEKPFKKTIGPLKNYKKDKKDKEINDKMLANYEQHLEKTKEHLKELSKHKLSPEIQKKQKFAIKYIDKKIHQLNKKLDRVAKEDNGRGMGRTS